MMRSLLIRGMLVGILAGLLAFSFAKVFGEPQVDRSIAFESAMDDAKMQTEMKEATAKGMPMPEAEPELVSRPTQSGIGLLTGVMVYSTAFGGLFALVFGFVYGRVGKLGARSTAVVLAATGFIAVYVVPNLKYPANPPAVGMPETIGTRTSLFFVMIAISIAAMIIAVLARQKLTSVHGAWNATLIAGGLFLGIVVIAQLLLPSINEVPENFPATVLWNFRLASLGIQIVLWTTLALVFGPVAEKALGRGHSHGALSY